MCMPHVVARRCGGTESGMMALQPWAGVAVPLRSAPAIPRTHLAYTLNTHRAHWLRSRRLGGV
eukprot:1522545-Prymnesium_polylepis.1